LIEKLAVHNRERIPERNVHARGATAYGTFTTTADMSNLTVASLFQGVGTKTDLVLRFSTVIHGSSSPEWLRDPRGFALKFYTNEGNYDIVGLSFPIFFIRDSIQFPDMIRSLKPNPTNGQQEWWRIWDFFSFVPESTHMFTWLLDDLGIPANYRTMDGWGVHTYKWINADGNATYVRYYFQSDQGLDWIDDDDAGDYYFSYATKDLYDAIETGNYPGWTFYIQTMTEEDMASLNWDPLDTTKSWPADQFPYTKIGHFQLNKNVGNQFLENEQAAFSPGRFVPGIVASDDKMLQGRVFAYADTQRYRLGVNYQLLPVNAPRCPYFDSTADGAMNFLTKETEINYFPSNFIKTQQAPAQPEDPEELSGTKQRAVISNEDNFEQCGDRWRSFDADRQARFASRVAAALVADRVTEQVQNIWLGYWAQCDPTLAQAIKEDMNALKKIDFKLIHKLELSEAEKARQQKRRAFMVASGRV